MYIFAFCKVQIANLIVEQVVLEISTAVFENVNNAPRAATERSGGGGRAKNNPDAQRQSPMRMDCFFAQGGTGGCREAVAAEPPRQPEEPANRLSHPDSQ